MKRRKIVLFIIFVLYLTWLFYETFSHGTRTRESIIGEAVYRVYYWNRINLVPFKTIKGYMRIKGSDDYTINVLGNIGVIIPFGILVPWIFDKFRSFWKMTMACLLLPVFIETVQLFVGRTTDIDDVILNFAGGMIGVFIFFVFYLLWKLIKTVRK